MPATRSQPQRHATTCLSCVGASSCNDFVAGPLDTRMHQAFHTGACCRGQRIQHKQPPPRPFWRGADETLLPEGTLRTLWMSQLAFEVWRAAQAHGSPKALSNAFEVRSGRPSAGAHAAPHPGEAARTSLVSLPVPGEKCERRSFKDLRSQDLPLQWPLKVGTKWRKEENTCQM